MKTFPFKVWKYVKTELKCMFLKWNNTTVLFMNCFIYTHTLFSLTAMYRNSIKPQAGSEHYHVL